MKTINEIIPLRTRAVSNALAFVWDMALVYIVYFLCRCVYLAINWDVIGEGWGSLDKMLAFKGSLLFDTSAILYTNILFAVMMLLPIHYRETNLWRKISKWLFVIVNSLAVVMNLADSVYFKYTGRRTTSTVFGEFSNEDNLGSIFFTEIFRHWYIVIIGLLLIYALWYFYLSPKGKLSINNKHDWMKYYAISLVCFIAYLPLTIAGMRGGWTTAVRPITISNASQYVNRPAESALILNTPFSMIRTIGKNVFSDPEYFSQEELNRLYSPLHEAQADSTFQKKNVVVIIIESFGREYIGAYNENLEGGKYKGYTPFVDSLVQKSMTFDYTFCNGRKSIDGMPSILSSVPMFKEPFFLTPSSMNDLSGLAGELANKGYYSAFFHGAENGSMGFEAFAKHTGFENYFGRTEYNQDKRFNGDKDFDGMWAIWDEEFLQFYALKMSEFKQPFMTSVFTASSHHPYKVPEKYKNIYKDEDNNEIHKCIRYVDMSLSKFFKTAEKQPWFKNTIFVITSDHTNLSDHAEYKTDLGGFGSPILIYDPSGKIPSGRRHCIAQHIDIMPTILGYLGYDKPYFAFGQDLSRTKDEDTWAVNYQNGVYQYVKGDYLIQLTDDGKLKGVYNYKLDWLMKKNLVNNNIPQVEQMEKELKAIIQSYMERMLNNELTYNGKK